MSLDLTTGQKLHITLRIATAMCFIGHGAFGIITKPIWCNYFAVFGIGSATAYKLMPIVGTFDVLAGITLLLYPLRIIPAWLVVWGLVTASLRPLSGEPFAELLERAGNFGAPLALLLLSATQSSGAGLKQWFRKLDPSPQLTPQTYTKVFTCLRIAGFLLLLGHGWLNLIEKKGLISGYQSLGFSNPAAIAHAAGLFEIAGALIILIRPLRPLILALFIWKVSTELFYPHYEMFEWIERGGSYGVLLALWFLSKEKTFTHIPLAT